MGAMGRIRATIQGLKAIHKLETLHRAYVKGYGWCGCGSYEEAVKGYDKDHRLAFDAGRADKSSGRPMREKLG